MFNKIKKCYWCKRNPVLYSDQRKIHSKIKDNRRNLIDGREEIIKVALGTIMCKTCSIVDAYNTSIDYESIVREDSCHRRINYLETKLSSLEERLWNGN